MVDTGFFSSTPLQAQMARAAHALMSTTIQDESLKIFGKALSVVSSHSSEFDGCNFTIQSIGTQFIDATNAVVVDLNGKDSLEKTSIHRLWALVYRLIVEFDLTISARLGEDLETFLEYSQVNRSEFPEMLRTNMNWIDRALPIQICKKALNTPELSNLKNISEFSKKINDDFEAWNSTLSKHLNSVEILKNALSEYKTGFNFVGLYQGFNQLSEDKKRSLFWQRTWMLLLGLLLLAPAGIEMMVIATTNQETLDISRLLVNLIPAITLTVFLAYFFRLSVRSVDSTKAQLLQIELRKTLCTFVQNYVDYVSSKDEAGKASLGKFESLIFSAIMPTDEKIPATFDGIEQISTLLKSARSS